MITTIITAVRSKDDWSSELDLLLFISSLITHNYRKYTMVDRHGDQRALD